MQLISTGIVVIPSAILLLFAYMSATSPRHSPVEAVVLALLGIGLTPLIYLLWGVVIWLKRGQSADADPGSLAARVAKKPYVAVVPVVIILALAFFLNGLSEGLDRSAAKMDVFAEMRTSCEDAATHSAKQNGADPTAANIKAMIGKYCSCYVLGVQTQYTPAELEKISTLDHASLAKQTKLQNLVAKCEKEAAG